MIVRLLAITALFLVACGGDVEAPSVSKESSPVAAGTPGDGGGAARCAAECKDAGPLDGTPGSFGAPCAGDGDCHSAACFFGGQGAFCSLRCTSNDDCPTPPSAGVCNPRGYCKK
jgi:hypothetical protein